MCLWATWTPNAPSRSGVRYSIPRGVNIHDVFREKGVTVHFEAVVLEDFCIFNTILGGGKRKNERGLPTERS